MLLPEPLAPTSATTSPGSTVSETPLSTGEDGDVAEDGVGRARPGPRPASSVDRARPVGDARLAVDDLEHADDAGLGLLPDGEQPGDDAHGRDELGEVGREGQERADRELVVHDEHTAEREHADLAERRNSLQRRGEAGGEAHGPHPLGEQRGRRAGEAVRARGCSWPKPLTTRTPVTFSSTTPATTPSCCWASQVAGNSLPRLRATMNPSPGPTSSATTVSSGDSVIMTTIESTNSRTLPLMLGRNDEQPLHQGDVGVGAADQLPGVELVGAAAVDALQRPEDVVAHVVLHVERQPPADIAPDIAEAEPQGAEEQQDDDVGRERIGPGDHDRSTTARASSGVAVWTSAASSAAPKARMTLRR